MRRTALISWLVLASAALCSGVWAAVEHHHTPCRTTLPSNVASLPPVEERPLAQGRVVAVDGADGTLTIEHRPIPRFYLEGTTRKFRVEDRALLTGLTPGDKIRFGLQHQQGRYVITRIENSN